MTPVLKPVPQFRNTLAVRSLMLGALAAAAVLLLSNFVPIPGRHAPLSALPLAMAGLGYALLQFRLKPPVRTLWKRLLLAATFLTWAIDQLLPPGQLATFIGDLVIAAYVLDLFWLIQEQLVANPYPGNSGGSAVGG